VVFLLPPELDSRIGGFNVIQQLGIILADKLLFVMTRNVMPDNVIAVEIVQDCQARLIVLSLQEWSQHGYGLVGERP